MKYVVKVKTKLETQTEEFPSKQARDMFIAQLEHIMESTSLKFDIILIDEENND